MSQKQVLKPRTCRHCGEVKVLTALDLRHHAEKEHGQVKPKPVGNSVHPKRGK